MCFTICKNWVRLEWIHTLLKYIFFGIGETEGFPLQNGNTTFPPILLFHLNKTGTQAEASILFYIINYWITFIQPEFSFWESPLRK